MYVMARHAHAGDKTLWTGDDRERPLSPVGLEQARNLVATLAGVAVHTLLSSPTTRCRQTLAPLAAARALPVDDHPLLAPDTPVDRLYDLVATTDLDGVLLCTHGEVLDALIERARARGFRAVPTSGSTAKGGAWLVDPRAPAARRWRYLPPVPYLVGDLMDAAPVLIRPLTSADGDAVRLLHEGLDERDADRRFRSGRPERNRTSTDPVCRQDGTHVGIGAFAGGTLLGVAYYTVTEGAGNPVAGPVADCAVVVSWSAQHHGVGTALTRHLTEIARARGVARAGVLVPAEDTVMLEVLGSLGWSRPGAVGVTVAMGLDLTEDPM